MPIALSSLAGLVYGFTAAICYAGLNTAIRFANVHMDIWHINFCRSLFGAAAMVIMARLGGGRILGSRRWTLCLLGFAGAAGVIALTADPDRRHPDYRSRHRSQYQPGDP